MPKLITLLVALLISLATVAHADCKDTGKPTWSKQLLELGADCETKIISPDGQKILLVKDRGDLSLSSAKGSPFKTVNYKVEPPAMASWAPNSQAFFIDDGEGSGLSSTFRLFRSHGAHVTRD